MLINRQKSLLLILFVFLACLAQPLMADEGIEARLTQRLQSIDPRLNVVSAEPTPVEGIYRVQINTGDLLYIHQEGEYIFAGSLLQVTDQGLVDLTERAQATQRQQVFANLPRDEQVIFPAEGETLASIAIFTDITCPYCVRLHEQVPELNAAGIEVRYLAFPRQGLNTPGEQLLANVWCAEDTREAMNRAKAGETLADQQCANPIASQFELGRAQGVQGTPAIILPDGQLVPGFVPAARLIQELGVNAP